MTGRLHLPDFIDLIEAQLDGQPHHVLAAVVWVRRLPRRTVRRACRRRDDRARLAVAERQSLVAYAVMTELNTAVTALCADYYGTAAPDDSGGQPRAYADPVIARIQDRRRRIEASGLTLIRGGAS